MSIKVQDPTTGQLVEIGSIIVQSTGGLDPSDADATVEEVLVDKTFYAEDAEKKTGTMPNRGTVNTDITTKAQEVTIQQGYHSGSGKVKISATEQAKIIASNIKSGVTILGQEGAVTPAKEEQTKTVSPTTSSQDVLPDTGKVLSKVTVNAIPTETKSQQPSLGSGNQTINATSGKFMTSFTITKDTTNHIASNIRSGKTLYGVTGNMQPAKMEETKTVTPNFSSGNVVVTPTSGKVMTQVTFSKDTTNHIAGNIKKDVTLYGVTGTYEGSGGGGTIGDTVSITESEYGGSISTEFVDGSGYHSGDYSSETLSSVYWIKLNSTSLEGASGELYITGATESELLSGKVVTGPISIDIYSRCLTGDTLVTLSDHSVKRIDELQLTDDYLSYDLDTGELVKDSVYCLDNSLTRSYEKMADRYNKCTFDDGTIIKEVHGHRFFNVTKGEFIYLMFWEIGDRIYKMDGTTPKLIAKETIYEPVPFYSVSTKNYHNGFANGCLYGDRHTQKYEINLVNGKPLQNKDKPTDVSIVWRERKLQEDKTKSWIERGKDE